MIRGFVLTVLLFAFPAQALVTIDWITVGDPGNSCDTQSQGCFGAVSYEYQIGKYEVSNAQYTEFLNAVAATDTYGLYYTSMGSGSWGGITRSGNAGSYSYSTIAGRENWPVNYVSFWDATRFANWLHNGQPAGAQDDTTTEDGAYRLTPSSIDANSVTRKVSSGVFVASEDEWYKAAYYKGGGISAGYWDYPAGTDAQIMCSAPGATANTANCGGSGSVLADGGSFTGSASPSGTFDQGGNVWEWNDTIINGSDRGQRGDSILGSPLGLAASVRYQYATWSLGGPVVGFRVSGDPSFTPGETVPLLSSIAVATLCTLLGLVGLGRLRR